MSKSQKKEKRKLAYLQLDSKNGTMPFVSQRGRLWTSQLQVNGENRFPYSVCKLVIVCVSARSPIQPIVRFKSKQKNGDFCLCPLGEKCAKCSPTQM